MRGLIGIQRKKLAEGASLVGVGEPFVHLWIPLDALTELFGYRRSEAEGVEELVHGPEKSEWVGHARTDGELDGGREEERKKRYLGIGRLGCAVGNEVLHEDVHTLLVVDAVVEGEDPRTLRSLGIA